MREPAASVMTHRDSSQIIHPPPRNTVKRRSLLSLIPLVAAGPALSACGSTSSDGGGSAAGAPSAGDSSAGAAASATPHVAPTVSDMTTPPKEFGTRDSLPEPLKRMPVKCVSNRYAASAASYVDLADLTVREIDVEAGTGDYRTVIVDEDSFNTGATTPGAAYVMNPGPMIVDDEFGYVLTGLTKNAAGGKPETHAIDMVKISLIDGSVSSKTTLWDDVDPKQASNGEVSFSSDSSALIITCDRHCISLSTGDLSILQQPDMGTREVIGDFLGAYDTKTGYTLTSLIDGSTLTYSDKQVPLRAFGKWLYIGNVGGIFEITSVTAVDTTTKTEVPITDTIPESTEYSTGGEGMQFTKLIGEYLVTCTPDAFDVRRPGDATAILSLKADGGKKLPDKATIFGDVIYTTSGYQKIQLLSLSTGEELSNTAFPLDSVEQVNHFGAFGNSGTDGSVFVPATAW